jgi:hypothetical protein
MLDADTAIEVEIVKEIRVSQLVAVGAVVEIVVKLVPIN